MSKKHKAKKPKRKTAIKTLNPNSRRVLGRITPTFFEGIDLTCFIQKPEQATEEKKTIITRIQPSNNFNK